MAVLLVLPESLRECCMGASMVEYVDRYMLSGMWLHTIACCMARSQVSGLLNLILRSRESASKSERGSMRSISSFSSSAMSSSRPAVLGYKNLFCLTMLSHSASYSLRRFSCSLNA